MNYNKLFLKTLALLVSAQHGVVLPMENILGGNVPVVNQQSIDEQSEIKKPKLTHEELTALKREIDAIKKDLNLDNPLTEKDVQDIKKIIDEINQEQAEENNTQKNDSAPNAFIPGLENFMPEIDKATKAFEKERKRAQYQNTILLGHPKCPIAFYRRDLMELPFFAADITIAYLFFENIKNKRVDYIYRSLTENTDFYIDLLTQLKETKKLLENPDTDKKEANVKLVELLGTIAEKHSYVGNNPFKLEIIIPFLSTILGHKLSRYAQEQCIVKRSFAPEAQYAYTQDNAGTYQRFEMEGYFATPTMDDWQTRFNKIKAAKRNRNDINPANEMMKTEAAMAYSLIFPGNAPMSTMSVIKGNFIPNPNANSLSDQIPDATEQLNTLDDLLARGIYKLAGLPNWLYEAKNSRAARFAMEVAMLATMTTQIDGTYNATWLKHIEKNIDALLILLRAHEAVKNLPKENIEKQAVCKDLLEFIDTGNTCASWKDACSKFFFRKTMGRMSVLNRVQAWLFTAVAASLLWKSRSLIKFGFMAAKNNMLPPEAWLVGGIATMYTTLLLAPVTLVLAVQVYRDACWIKDKVTDTIKSFFSKDNDTQPTNNEQKQADTSSAQSNETNSPKEALA